MPTRFLAILLPLLAFLSSVLLPPSSFASPPNVLFIVVDDLNDWIGPLAGHPQVRTPNLDRLAARGVTFTNAHCQAPVCNPSRTSFLTGLRPSTSGVYALDPFFRSHQPLKHLVTLPQHFQSHGYTTISTGKIHHDAYPPRKQRVDGNEFSRWGFQGSHGPIPKDASVGLKHPMLTWGVYPGPESDLSDTQVADYAVEQLRTLPADKPFFLAIGFRRPHVPCLAPQQYLDLYPDDDALVMPPVKENDRDDVPAAANYLHWRIPEPRINWLREHNQWRPLVRSYLACITYMDAQLGRVLDALDASPHADDTLIVLLSDHGWHLGEKGMTGKLSLWERSTRVPLIFAGPGIAKSAKSPRPVELLDLYPTLAELAGLPVPSHLEGHSLSLQLKDPTAPRDFPAITTQNVNNHSVRTERYRYTRYFDGTEELYDHTTDSHEWTNLAASPAHAPTKAALAKHLPQLNTPAIPGSQSRFFELRNNTPHWEGRPIPPTATTLPDTD